MKRLFPYLVALLALGVGLTVGTAAQDDVIEIDFVHIFGEVQNEEEITDVRIAVIEEIAQAFMAENPGIVINPSSISTDYVEVFDAALASATQGNAPHIVQVEEGLTQLAIDTGLFVPISDVASEEQLATLDDLLPQIRDYYSLGDQIWGIPWNTSNPLLYYNRGMFEAAGLDPDVPPRTFADVLTYCDALMSADLELTTCMTWPMATWFPEQWVAMQGALIANNSNGRDSRATEVFYNSEEMLFVSEWWKEMADNGYYSYSGSVGNYSGELIPFGTKRAAMTINTSGALSNIISLTSGPPFEMDLGVGQLPIPTEEATNGVTVGGASVWLMGDHSEEELQAAADFIFFLTTTMNDTRWFQGSGYFATRQSSVENLREEGWFDDNPEFELAINQLINSEINEATSGAIIGPSAEVRGHLVNAFQAIIDNGDDPASALAVAKEAADQELADYNALFE